MKNDKEWYEGFKWSESVFKEMYFDEALTKDLSANTK